MIHISLERYSLTATYEWECYAGPQQVVVPSIFLKRGLLTEPKTIKSAAHTGGLTIFISIPPPKKKQATHFVRGGKICRMCFIILYIRMSKAARCCRRKEHYLYKMHLIILYAATVIPRGFPQYLQFTKPSQIFNIHDPNRPLCALTSSVL